MSIPSLCLNMIVKNESKIITRLFDSVISIIDTYCICDTGSTDNTIELITNYFESKGIKGKIITEPFINFCHNRNFSLKKCIGMSDYVLLMDADMCLDVKNFDKQFLKSADHFCILQGSDSFYYPNMRIVKNNGKYNYVGVTHEYIDVPPNSISSNIPKDKLFIKDIGDGGSKSDKFERDIRLLTKGIEDEPNNVRYHFYLANSYHDSGKYEEAIEWYKKRIEFGSWKEEVWYSYYRIGLCYMKMNKIPDAFYNWMEGYNYYPERLEGIYEIIKYYRLASKNKLAKIYFDIAFNILKQNHNRDGYLFLHNDVYTYKIYYEFTICAYYLGCTNINDQVVSILNNSKEESLNNNLLSNIKFYKDILVQKNKLNFNNNLKMNIDGKDYNFNSSSSCLIKNPNYNTTNSENTDSYYLMNVRYVNYQITPSGSYTGCEKQIITINNVVELDKNLNIISNKSFDLVNDKRFYLGIEDVKIFNDCNESKLLFIGTGYHIGNKIGVSGGEYTYNNLSLNPLEFKQNFSNTNCEKNWVYVNYNNSTHIIYNWFPISIGKLNEQNELIIIEKKNTPGIFKFVRGSTCGFTYLEKNEIWFVGHIVSYEQPRHYYHIISVFDLNMNLLKYSAPFKFEGEPIEYCLSIFVNNDEVLINYSVWDRTTNIGVYSKSYIDTLLKYV